MFLQAISDLHTEFLAGEDPAKIGAILTSIVPPKPIPDYLLIGGDLGVMGQKWLIEAALQLWCNIYPNVIYVAGNHEYYHSSLEKFRAYADELEERYENLIVATSGRSFYLDDTETISLHACTLWFVPHPESVIWYHGMADAHVIEDSLCTIEQRGLDDVYYLKENVRPGDIVLTHHMPLYSAVPEQFQGSKLNYFFVNDEAKTIIDKNRPAYFLFGHTHNSCNYTAGDTRVICNPYGYYPDSLNKQFIKQLIIEV